MAISKKGKRPIVVDNHKYRWQAYGMDYGIRVIIFSDANANGQPLRAHFQYYHNTGSTELNGGGYSKGQQLIVTPQLVRQIILYGLSEGWTPLEDKKTLFLGYLDDVLDLQIGRHKPIEQQEAVHTLQISDGDIA